MASSLESPHSDGYLQVSSAPSISIFYTITGPTDGSKPIILLSNSLAATTKLWDPFAREFHPEYTIIRYDPRFHGLSPPSPDPNFDYPKGHTIDDLAADVIKLLDHLKIQKLQAIIGFSIGAAVGLFVGAKHSERVHRIFVVATKAAGSPAADAAHDKRIAYGRANGPVAAGKQSVGRWFSQEYTASHPEAIAFVESIVCGQGIDGLEANIMALRKLDLWPVVENIGMRRDGGRFVFVAGDKDAGGSMAKDARELAEKAGTDAKVVVLEGVGHIVPVEVPEKFYEVVRSHIA